MDGCSQERERERILRRFLPLLRCDSVFLSVARSSGGPTTGRTDGLTDEGIRAIITGWLKAFIILRDQSRRARSFPPLSRRRPRRRRRERLFWSGSGMLGLSQSDSADHELAREAVQRRRHAGRQSQGSSARTGTLIWRKEGGREGKTPLAWKVGPTDGRRGCQKRGLPWVGGRSCPGPA